MSDLAQVLSAAAALVSALSPLLISWFRQRSRSRNDHDQARRTADAMPATASQSCAEPWARSGPSHRAGPRPPARLIDRHHPPTGCSIWAIRGRRAQP